MRTIAVVTILALAVLPAAAQTVVPIQVSPAVIVLGAPVAWVTVHADIPYGSVSTASIELNGLAVSWTKADSRGDLVAKFDFDDVTASITTPSVTFTLTGLTKTGDAFEGSATVRVRQR